MRFAAEPPWPCSPQELHMHRAEALHSSVPAPSAINTGSPSKAAGICARQGLGPGARLKHWYKEASLTFIFKSSNFSSSAFMLGLLLYLPLLPLLLVLYIFI